MMGAKPDEMRAIKIIAGTSRYSEGSCDIHIGNTIVRCTATVENYTPFFLRGKNRGWLTAEYAMLPRATESRTDRRQNLEGGRTKEIQRLIGRSLRSAFDFSALADWQIKIDCDVLEADGGTRTAAITGGFVAACLAMADMRRKKILKTLPIKHHVAAVSCGMVDGMPCLDLDYLEDKDAETDANFVLDEKQNFIEIQACAENKTFRANHLVKMTRLAMMGIDQLVEQQKTVLDKIWQS